ncbi:MAG: zinc-dependent metalloprotease [Bacteroidales bacterium]
MRKRHLLISMLFGCFCGGSLSAQHTHSECPLPCKAHEVIQQYYELNPEAKTEHTKYRASRRNRAARPDSYVIPVVFHVFGKDFLGQKVDDVLIKDALRRTNEDFQGLTSNWGDENPAFDGIKRPLNITFKLAEIDSDGNATSGILYHPEEKGFGNYWHDKLPDYAWDNYSYMNIYLMLDLYGDGVTNNSGVSWYPDKNMSDQNLARVTYNPRYIGANTSENFRRVLTHEFGHFLNLAHTFDNGGGGFPDGCADGPNGEINPGDFVDDTPAADKMLMTESDRNCHNELTNWTNFMNYTDRYSMFTVGQVDRMLDALDHDARITLWSEENLKRVFFDSDVPRIIPGSVTIKEASANDGSFMEFYKFTLKNAQIATIKTLTEGADYTVENLPSGLRPRLVAVSETELRLFIDGEATSHITSDNKDNIRFTLKNSVLTAGELYRNDVVLSLNFLDPYTIIHEEAGNIQISAGFTWKYLKLKKEYNNSEFGIMFDATSKKLFIESYQKAMVGTGIGQNLAFIAYGEAINNKSQWVNGKTYPNLHTIASANYKEWNGKTGFIGIQFRANDNKGVHYGWMRIAVAEDGSSFILKDYAFNEAPGKEILAGQVDENPLNSILVFSTNEIKEDPANDGRISSSIRISIMGENNFVKEGVLVSGTDYTTNRIPKGMTAKIEVKSPKEAVFTLEGTALSHNSRTDYAYVNFKESIFSQTGMQNTKQDIDIIFIDPYRIVSEEVSYSAGPGNKWKYFSLPSVSAEYGAWEFAAGHLKLQTYSKQAICYPQTKNLVPLPSETEVGPSSDWATPLDQYANVFDIHSVNFTEWRGKTAYVGIKIPFEGNHLYGWMKITVDKDGTSYTVTEIAFNEAPNASLLTGQLETSIGAISDTDNGQIYFDVQNKELYLSVSEKSQVTVFDLNGQTMISATVFCSTEKISLQTLVAGIYLIKIENASFNKVEKLIIP